MKFPKANYHQTTFFFGFWIGNLLRRRIGCRRGWTWLFAEDCRFRQFLQCEQAKRCILAPFAKCRTIGRTTESFFFGFADHVMKKKKMYFLISSVYFFLLFILDGSGSCGQQIFDISRSSQGFLSFVIKKKKVFESTWNCFFHLHISLFSYIVPPEWSCFWQEVRFCCRGCEHLFPLESFSLTAPKSLFSDRKGPFDLFLFFEKKKNGFVASVNKNAKEDILSGENWKQWATQIWRMTLYDF